MEYARKFKWVESGKESLGYPLVQRMTESAAEAMWADANINITQQWIFKKHLCYQLGKGHLLQKINFLWIVIITLCQRIMENISTLRMEINFKRLRSAPIGLAMPP